MQENCIGFLMSTQQEEASLAGHTGFAGYCERRGSNLCRSTSRNLNQIDDSMHSADDFATRSLTMIIPVAIASKSKEAVPRGSANKE